jgi:hypothetical protein
LRFKAKLKDWEFGKYNLVELMSIAADMFRLQW